MRRFRLIFTGLLLCGLLAGMARAATFQLTDGRTLTGEIVTGSANEGGLQFRLEDGQYERVPWASFSQDDLKKFAQDRKLSLFVAPYIEVTREERLKRSQVRINDVPRLERPEARSLVGAMFSSSVGVFVFLLLYAGNLYAAYEIAVFRARPRALVCGVSAVLPVIGPIIFLSLPTLMEQVEEGAVTMEAPPPVQPFAVPNAAAATASDTTGLHLARAEAGPAAGAAATQVFQRGAFTFNRRFFETKFPGFFGIVRRDADKDMVLAIRSPRGEFVGNRISRITANDLHLQIQKGTASEEVMIPFGEIQEIKLKHKDA